MGSIIIILAAFCLGAPAVRLLRTAREEGHQAELWLGLGLAFGALGLPLRFYSGIEVALHADLGASLPVWLGQMSAGAHLLVGLAAACLYTFVWRVFHPGSQVVRTAVMIILSLLMASMIWILLSGGHRVERHASVLAANVARGMVFPWCAIESFRYWKLMKRRVALGIGDPVVANRFALWATWSGAFSILPGVVLLAKLIGRTTGDSAGALSLMLPVLRISMLFAVIVAFGCIWLSFFPPVAYREWIRRSGSGLDPI